MSPRVLCIEGDAALRERVKAVLEGAGFSVDATASGLEGIARARMLPPDLIVADVHLPDLEGAELAARLKGEKSLAGVPFLAVGDSREEHDVALAAGADGFIGRSIDDHLCDEVKAYLAGKRETLAEADERGSLRSLAATMSAHLEAALSGEAKAAERLRETDRLKSAFMHNLAHELSTPLTPLAGYLRIFQSDKLGSLSPQQKRVVESMLHSVGRLTRIVDNLSDFASLQSGRSPLLEAELEPDKLADDVVAEFRGAIKDARLHVAVTHAGPGTVVADLRKLRQALANLVGNAVKFSPHGGEVLVEVLREARRLRFSVFDQGPGIVAGEAERIFEPLYHAAARGSLEARAPGSGLGLPVARRLAEAHGGRVWVESPPRTQPAGASRHFTGSKFVLEIPLQPADRPAEGPAGTPAASLG